MKMFKNHSELIFLSGFAAFCVLYYLANRFAFAKFIGSLAGVSLDPIVILAAFICFFIGKKYSTSLSLSFGVGLVVAIVQSASRTKYMEETGFGGQPVDGILILAYIVIVPLLTNIMHLIRTLHVVCNPDKKQ